MLQHLQLAVHGGRGEYEIGHQVRLVLTVVLQPVEDQFQAAVRGGRAHVGEGLAFVPLFGGLWKYFRHAFSWLA